MYDLNERIVQQTILHALRPQRSKRIIRGDVIGGLTAIAIRLEPGDAASAHIKQIAIL